MRELTDVADSRRAGVIEIAFIKRRNVSVILPGRALARYHVIYHREKVREEIKEGD